MPNDLSYKDPTLLPRVLDLYETTWPGLAANIVRAGELGWRWDAVSRPFVVQRDGKLVGHVGVLEYDVLLRGVRTSVAGVHAVCTDPAYRGQGVAREALAAALSYVDELGVPSVLATEVPEVYEPHGFSVLSEQRWRVTPGGRGRGSTRTLSADKAEDLALVERLHAGRVPLSDALCSLAPTWMFGICAVLNTGGLGWLRYAPDLDAILVWTQSGSDIVLFDVVAHALPSLSDVLDHLPPSEAVVCAFGFDRFDAGADHEVAPIPAPTDDLWMGRGITIPGGVQMPILGRH